MKTYMIPVTRALLEKHPAEEANTSGKQQRLYDDFTYGGIGWPNLRGRNLSDVSVG
jgi:hypothetical protein